MRGIVCLEPSKKNGWVYVAKAFQVAYDIAGGLLLGVLLGLFLDRLFHTKAVFLVALSLWGIWHGLMAMIHLGDEHDQK